MLSEAQLARSYAIECLALQPPYRSVEPVPLGCVCNTCPALGAVIFAHGRSTLGALATLTACTNRWPWVAPALTLPEGEGPLEPYLRMICELGDRLAVVKTPASDIRHWIPCVVGAIAQRPPPGSKQMASYVVGRIRSAEMRQPLMDQFTQALEGVPATTKRSVASYSRLFARCGCYSAHHWRMLARLVHQLCTLRVGCTAADADMALNLVHVRTADRYARRFLQISWCAARQRVGWEWVLETALRTGGYVSGVTP